MKDHCCSPLPPRRVPHFVRSHLCAAGTSRDSPQPPARRGCLSSQTSPSPGAPNSATCRDARRQGRRRRKGRRPQGMDPKTGKHVGKTTLSCHIVSCDPKTTDESMESMPSLASKAPLIALVNSDSSKLIKQGAEAKVYRSQLVPDPVRLVLPVSDDVPNPEVGGSVGSSRIACRIPPVILKYRFPKNYRHPSLSESITSQRTISEARALVRCTRNGVNVPSVVAVDEKSGILALEWIEGRSVRELLGGDAEEDGGEEDQSIDDEGEMILTDHNVKGESAPVSSTYVHQD